MSLDALLSPQLSVSYDDEFDGSLDTPESDIDLYSFLNERPRKITALKQRIDTFFDSYSHFHAAIYVITRRKTKHLLSSQALTLIGDVDEAMQNWVDSHSHEFYTHVLVLFARYLEHVPEYPLERDILDGLFSAIIVSAKICIDDFQIQDFRKELLLIHFDKLCNLVEQTLQDQVKHAHYLLNNNNFWVKNQSELRAAIAAVRKRNATKEQEALFEEAVANLSAIALDPMNEDLQIRRLLEYGSYLEIATLLEMEKLFLKNSDWRIAVLCDKAQLHQFMLHCWHYAVDPNTPSPLSNPSGNLHQSILYTFDHTLKHFGKVTATPPFTAAAPPSPETTPRATSNDDDNDDDQPIVGLTLAFDSLKLKEKKPVAPKDETEAHYLREKLWSP